MRFEPGKIIEEFDLGGRNVRFRYPEKRDAEQLMNYINALVKDREFIGKQKPVSKQEEIKWLRSVLRGMRKGEMIDMVIELDGKIVGNSQIEVNPLDAAKKSGEFSLGIIKEAQNMGIGKRLMDTLIKQSKLLKLKTIEIDAFGLNERALHVYEGAGFRRAGTIPHYYNHYGKYCNKIILYREVPE